jgi:hypothetical protein
MINLVLRARAGATVVINDEECMLDSNGSRSLQIRLGKPHDGGMAP